jgi:Cu-processing system permease protein
VNTTLRIAGYEMKDVMRGKWLLFYGAFFLLLTEGLFRFGGEGARVILSLVNLVLLLVPLVGVLFGTVYLYGAREFNELLLAQPVSRRQLFGGLYLGLALPLAGALLVGVGVPFVFRGLPGGRELSVLLVLLGCGVALTFIFVALAFLIAIRITDRMRGLGGALLLWLAFAVLYDGAILLGVTLLSEYPLERPLLFLVLLNPVDLARILLLLNLDVAALMGYTGATLQRFFGTLTGMVVTATALALWTAVPLLVGSRLFVRKDF